MRPEEEWGEGQVLALRFAHLYWDWCHFHHASFFFFFQTVFERVPLGNKLKLRRRGVEDSGAPSFPGAPPHAQDPWREW